MNISQNSPCATPHCRSNQDLPLRRGSARGFEAGTLGRASQKSFLISGLVTWEFANHEVSLMSTRSFSNCPKSSHFALPYCCDKKEFILRGVDTYLQKAGHVIGIGARVLYVRLIKRGAGGSKTPRALQFILILGGRGFHCQSRHNTPTQNRLWEVSSISHIYMYLGRSRACMSVSTPFNRNEGKRKIMQLNRI